MTRSLGFEDLDTSILLVAKLLVELRALFKFCPVENHNGWIDLAVGAARAASAMSVFL